MGAPARLLVVDDEPRTAELTAELLRRAGYTVEVAEHPQNGTRKPLTYLRLRVPSRNPGHLAKRLALASTYLHKSE